MDATTKSSQTPSSQSPIPPDSIHDTIVPTPTPKPTPSTNKTNKKSGIDVKDALSILSTRRPQRYLHSTTAVTPNDNDNDKEKNGDEPTTIVTAEQKKMGQTIDLFRSEDGSSPTTPTTNDDTNTNNNQNSSSSPPNNNNNNNTSSSSSKNTDLERQKLLQSQTPSQLLQTLFQLQQERVLTYRQFDDGLEVVLQTGNLTQYPHLTVRVTAAFAVVSCNIKEVANVFQLRLAQQQQQQQEQCSDGGGGAEVVKWIETLQGLEKEKLNYTAALHLEKIRGRNEVVEREIASQNGGGTGGNDGNERIAQLLEESIVSLEGKVRGCVEEINEILEELRYAAADMDE